MKAILQAKRQGQNKDTRRDCISSSAPALLSKLKKREGPAITVAL